MPRYSLEKLRVCQFIAIHAAIARNGSTLPLILDDLAEAVQHAIVGVGTGGLGLQLTAGFVNTARVLICVRRGFIRTLGF